MMEAAWRQRATGTWPDWMADWMIPFAQAIDGAKKYVRAQSVRRDVGGDPARAIVLPASRGVVS
jgi:hypothetical protein